MLYVACHDTGGAQVLAHWLLNTDQSFHANLKGPSVRVFIDTFGTFTQVSTLPDLAKYSNVITSTSWQSDHEKIMRKHARKEGIYSIAVLDHWTHYRNRFSYDHQLVLPDEVWVTDDYSFALATLEFAGLPIKQIPNYFIAYIRSQYAQKHSNLCFHAKKTRSGKRVLYVFEPDSEHRRCLKESGADAHLLEYDELSAFSFFIHCLSFFPYDISHIILRPHPSEDPLKYQHLVSNMPISIFMSVNHSLVDDLCESDIIVGCQSMAIYIGAMCGLEAYSSIPPNGGECILPTQNIKMLRDLL